MNEGLRSKYIIDAGKRFVPSLLFLLLACDQGVTPLPPPQPTLPPISTLENIVVKQTYYDSVLVESGEEFLAEYKTIDSIIVGEQVSTGFRQLASIRPTYIPSETAFRVNFTLKAKFDSSLVTLPLVIRYHFIDSATFDIQREIATTQYPYPSAEVFYTPVGPISAINYVQDVDKDEEKVYFYHRWPTRIWEYNSANKQLIELFAYNSGSHIAVDSPFVFLSGNETLVDRYDLRTDSLTSWLIRTPNNASIRGLEIYDGSLYVLTDLPPGNIRRYSYDGELLDSISYPIPTTYMTIHNDILYSAQYPDRLARFDLNKRNTLPSISAPTFEGDGIRIADGYLYYCDRIRRFVGRIPLEDFLEPSALVQQ